MDNVTHTLIGVAVSHALTARPGRKPGPDRRRAIFWTSVIANNLPDLDFLLALLGGSFATKLGFLLHHRGFSHTFLAVPCLAALSAALGALFGGAGFRRDYGRLFGVGALGICLHVAADSMNDYGVHPFSPFANGWYYGDFIFILEPLLWFALLPLAFQEARARAASGLWALLGAAILAVSWFGPFVPWPVALLLTGWAAAVTLVQRRYRGVRVAFIAAGLVLAVFAAGSGFARSAVRAALRAGAPGEEVLQLVTTPAPADPFCWRALVASRTPDGAYVARLGGLSFLPSLLPPARCNYGLIHVRTAPLGVSTLPSSPGLVWAGEFRGPWSELVSVGAGDCRAAAFFRYARIPFWSRLPEGLVVGDLRYDRERELGFAEFLLQPGGSCPEHLPPWTPPLRNSL